MNVNTALAAPELQYVLRDSGAKAIVVSEEFAPVLQAALAAAPQGSGSGAVPGSSTGGEATVPALQLQQVIWVPASSGPAPGPAAATGGSASTPAQDMPSLGLQVLTYSDWVQAGVAALSGGPRPHGPDPTQPQQHVPQIQIQIPEVDDDEELSAAFEAQRAVLARRHGFVPIDGFHMYYTSGTTGLPKGVVLSHAIIMLHALGTIRGERRGKIGWKIGSGMYVPCPDRTGSPTLAMIMLHALLEASLHRSLRKLRVQPQEVRSAHALCACRR